MDKAECNHDSAGEGTRDLRCGCELPYVGCLAFGSTVVPSDPELPVCSGTVNGTTVSVLRDTGCTTAVIKRTLVTAEQLTGRFKCYRMIDGTVRRAETALVHVDSPYFTGEVECLCFDTPICDVVIGNIPDARMGNSLETTAAVLTRAQSIASGKPSRSLSVPKVEKLQLSVADMPQLQRDSPDLERYFQLAGSGESTRSGRSATVKFVVQDQLLYRIHETDAGRVTKHLVVPKDQRTRVLSLAHESIMSGHLRVNKSLDRVLSQFYWPEVMGDVTRYCRSCDTCQRTTRKGRVTKAPLQKMPIVSVPFHRVVIDLIGPIVPASSSGNKYILTVVDYATRYPEAVALPGISTEQVAEALCKVYSRVGVPTQIVTDQGTQFMSDVMKEVSRLLSIEHVTSSPYHPQCNGLVEKFNGTLKSMIKKLCTERPKDWDRYLEPALFAYREVRHETLGFSPFEMLYGRTVRGPMAILREVRTKEVPEDEVQTTYQYVSTYATSWRIPVS